MKFLKSERAWKIWVNKELSYEGGAARHEVPKQFPCFVYLVVLSFGYEEQAPEYLYPADVAKMAKLVREAAK